MFDFKFWSLLVVVPFILVIFIVWAAHTSLFSGVILQPYITSEYLPQEKTNSLADKHIIVMSWNIGFAYGIGSEGSGYQKLPLAEMKKRLDEVSQVIDKYSPDIIFLQEVDFNSDRSHNIDQLAYLANKNGYKNFAYAISWEHNYVPFPYWPIRNQWAKMSSGGGILSRFPISSNEVTLYDKPEVNAWWYNLFYLFRYSQKVSIKIDNHQVELVNNHLEAFDKNTRQQQASELAGKLKKSYSNKPLIVAGDFNTTPTGAKMLTGFEDLGDNNYEDDNTYRLVDDLPFLSEIVNLSEYMKNESKWFTFSSVNPDRRLDYVFISEHFEVLHNEIDKTQVSDHFPIISKLKLNL